MTEPFFCCRLCVPCFTHFASNGTNVNANRPSIKDLIHSEGYDLNEVRHFHGIEMTWASILRVIVAS